MPKCDKLLSRARENPGSLRFEEACALAECWGYVKKDSKQKGGSHRKFKHAKLKLPKVEAMCSFQEHNGMAKPYQVRQLLEKIEYIETNHPDYQPT